MKDDWNIIIKSSLHPRVQRPMRSRAGQYKSVQLQSPDVEFPKKRILLLFRYSIASDTISHENTKYTFDSNYGSSNTAPRGGVHILVHSIATVSAINKQWRYMVSMGRYS